MTYNSIVEVTDRQPLSQALKKLKRECKNSDAFNKRARQKAYYMSKSEIKRERKHAILDKRRRLRRKQALQEQNARFTTKRDGNRGYTNAG